MFNLQKRSTKSIPLVKSKIDKDFEQSMKRLCQNLLSYLKEAQESAAIAEERLKQAQAILKPWPALPTDEVDCLCKNLETMTVTKSNDDLALMDNISKTLDSAKTLRLKETKSCSKLMKGGGKSSSSSISGKSSVSEKSLTSNRSSLSIDKSVSSSVKSTPVSVKSASANYKSTSGKSTLVSGKPISACSKSTSPYLLKTSTAANTKTSNTRARKSASTARILSGTSKISATTTKVFGHIDSTKISLQPNIVPSKPNVSSTSTGTIPKTISSTIKRPSLQLGTSSQSTVHSTSKVNFVFINTASSTDLQMSSKDSSNVKTKSVQFTLQNTRGTLPKHSISSLHASTQPAPSSVSCTSLATGSTRTEHAFTRRIPIQSSEKSSRVSFSKKSISTSTIPAVKKEIDSSKSKTELHCPSCACYKTKDEQPKSSTLSLSEALAVYRIPSTLRTSAKYYQRFVQQAEKEAYSKSDSKTEFLQALHTRNEKTIDTYMENKPWINEFVKYISIYATYEKKLQTTKCDVQMHCVPYTNTKDLANYLNNKCKVKNKELWNQILRSIIDDVMPTVKTEGQDKFHVIQMLKTICKFASNTVPSVPIFKIN